MNRRRWRRRVRRAAAALVALTLLSGAGIYHYLTAIYPERGGPGQGQPVEVDLPWGGGARSAARSAANAGVVDDPRLFALYLRLSGWAGRLKAGRHQLRDDWSPSKVARALSTAGAGAQVRVTLREGLTRFEMAEELERQGICARQAFLEATEAPELLERFGVIGASAEGYLFPDTYHLAPGTEPTRVVVRLLRTFRSRTAEAFSGRRDQLAALGREMLVLEAELGAGPFAALGDEVDPVAAGRHAVVILASMVEAETPIAEERPRVAAVAFNRLRSPRFPHRKLQFDPTVSYGCLAEPRRASSCAGGFEPLATRHLMDEHNRYSTYAHPGLPPGPIGNPSLQSLEAVLSPADTDDLYFVASGDGGHVFSETLEAHQAAVERYRRRQGSLPADGGALDADE